VATGEYGLPEYLPGYFAFGGNGGGELFVLPLFGSSRPVLMVPAIGMAPRYLVKIAEDFAALECAMSPGRIRG
jgi:hypothetical protein